MLMDEPQPQIYRLFLNYGSILLMILTRPKPDIYGMYIHIVYIPEYRTWASAARIP